jgi:class 3 adenylate cyclase/ActR/RegA family two-component response regulator
MQRHIIILQSDAESAKMLGGHFRHRGDQVWMLSSAAQVLRVLERGGPALVLIDLHIQEEVWVDLLNTIRKDYPDVQVIITNKKPDVRLELLAKEYGARVFLRAPFTPTWIERALNALASDPHTKKTTVSTPLNQLPKVRVPMRLKITLPYILLSFIFILASTYLVSKYVLESMQERFTNQLIEMGKVSADLMVSQENHMLETARLLANTAELANNIKVQDSEALRTEALPVAINYQSTAIEILDLNGSSLLSLRRQPDDPPEAYEATRGDNRFALLEFVQNVLENRTDEHGDKFAGIAPSPQGYFFYISAPIFDSQGSLVGAVLIGESLSKIVRQMQKETLANITFYDDRGMPLASTHALQNEITPLDTGLAHSVLLNQDAESTIRDFRLASISYSEILGPWEVRWGDDLGVMGVSLAQNFLVKPNNFTQVQAIFIVSLSFLATLFIGLLIARKITLPLSHVVRASTEVAEGNFKVKVPADGNDEVMVLAHAFNYMVTGLQEGSIYRDLLGRTVSPQVREALRKSFASGELRLEGQNAVATVLMSDIRNFTTISERERPTTILAWLNEYFRELVPVITKHGGVVDKFEGDAILAFFGILPTPLPPEESAYQACQAAVEMLDVLEKINLRRAVREEQPLITGIGINTGSLTAGGLGTADRLNYTIIGDTVNTTQRIEGLTRQFGESAVVISENTLTALQGRRGKYHFVSIGEHGFKGKSEMLWVYRLVPEDRHLAATFLEDTKPIRIIREAHEKERA